MIRNETIPLWTSSDDIPEPPAAPAPPDAKAKKRRLRRQDSSPKVAARRRPMTDPETPRIARVIVEDRVTEREFDYLIPDALRGAVSVGSRVRVPFRHRQLMGTVIGLRETAEVAESKLRPLIALAGGGAGLSRPMLRLARWMSDYYAASVESCMRCVLPEVVRKGEMSFKERRVARLTHEPDAEERASVTKRSPRRGEVIDALIAAPGMRMPVPDLLDETGVSRDTLKALVTNGLVVIETESIGRDPWASAEIVPDAPLALSPEQATALEAVRAAMAAGPDEQKPLLLHGVTGSGKTEIYLQAITDARAKGKGALVLVPEISLTPQTVERFRARFASKGDGVAVLHSRLSAGERHDEWHRIHSGDAPIVIGARSAVFAPVRDLGLIVVDEEHEGSYKQEDSPRYHARDLAVVRAQLEECPVVLGSATPSLESMHNARTGKYRLLTLPVRVDDQRMPLTRVVDLRLAYSKSGPTILSERLRSAIEARLERKEQVILFLNRRGFASALVCPRCGFVCECPNCSLALTFHRGDDALVCHLCGHRKAAPHRCPQVDCKDPGIRHRGFGTERVEEVVKKVFPKARVARMDADTMARKDAHRDALALFREGKTDILVGTQMIAKGLHFPRVTLVGIINADLSLHLNDFRAAERTFQLITQVAGRAGRGDVEGEVIVQTSTPGSPAVQYARRHDYDGFFEQEIALREATRQPPFEHVILLTVRGKSREKAEFTAQTLARRLAEGLPKEAELQPPMAAPIERLREEWRFHLLMRSTAVKKLSAHVRRVLDALQPLPEEVFATVDVDPQQLL